MSKTKETRKFELIAKLLSKNASEKEMQDIKKYSSAEFQELQKVWDMTGRLQASPEHRKNWETLAKRFKNNIPQTARALPMQKKKANAFIPFSLKLAAGILIAFLSIFAIHNIYFGDIRIVTLNGEKSTVELPDGTTIELNAGSGLTYSKNYSNSSRIVALRGEAYFNVMHGRSPFIITTPNARIEVLGTSFNLKSRKSKTILAVNVGRVVFSSPVNSEKVILEKGEFSQIEFEGGPTAPQKADIQKFIAWRTGEILFERTPVTEVFTELERQFDVEIESGLPDIEQLTYTGRFTTRQPVLDILENICLAFGWQVEQTDGVFKITRIAP